MKPQSSNDQQHSESRPATSKSTSAPKTLNVCGVSVSCTHAEGPQEQPSLVSKPRVRLFASEGKKLSSRQSQTITIDVEK
jgi:hypothetical protein